MNIYHQNAAAFVAQYESVSAEKVHQSWLHLLPSAGSASFALDVGAGSGRDARFWAVQGFQVVAVEPAENLRHAAMALANTDKIQLFADAKLRQKIRPAKPMTPTLFITQFNSVVFV